MDALRASAPKASLAACFGWTSPGSTRSSIWRASIVAKNTLAHLAKRVEHELGGHDLGREVMRGHEAIERLAGEMHAAILQLRMVPVARVFRSFPRLVRDTARELNKTVTLVLSGETTEADKTIVDHLFEPLLHLVRNAPRSRH